MNPTAPVEPVQNKQDFFVKWREIDDSIVRHVTDEYWEWKRFSESLSDLTIYEHPDYILQESQQESQRPSFLIQYREAGELRGVAALIPKLFKTRAAGTIGWHRNLWGYRLAGKNVTLRDRSQIPLPLLEELLGGLRKLNSPFILAEDLKGESPLYQALAGGAVAGYKAWGLNELQPRLQCLLPERQEDYWAKFSGKTRSKLRRRVNKPENLRLERITEPDQVGDFLQHANAISRRSWQSARLGLRIRNDASELRQFAEMASLGWLRCYLLFQGDVPITFVVGNQLNGLYNYEETGYDQSYAEISPGQIIICLMLDDFYSWNRPDVFDFGGGDASYKQLFSTTQSESGCVWITKNDISANLLMGWVNSCQSIRGLAKNMLKKAGAFTKLRQSFRRPGAQSTEDNS